MPTTTKKAAPKKSVAAKKTTAKKTSKKATPTLRSLVYASNHQSFWVSNGLIQNSLVALSEALKQMEKEVFQHHVSKDKNDFADWVYDVLGDSSCATDLRKAKTLPSARSVVVKHLKFYKL